MKHLGRAARGGPSQFALERDGSTITTDRSVFRWVICGLLVLITANNYLDRQVLGVLAPELIRRHGWSETDYVAIVFWFQVGFAVGFPLMGRFLDLVGTRLGFAVAVVAWSIAAVWHGLVGSVVGFKAARLALGLAQPSNMPAGVKAVAEWFAPDERAFAMGIFKGGANIGAILVPVLVPVVYFHYGARVTFVTIASTGFIWVGLWLWLYRTPASCANEPAAEPPAPDRAGWRQLLLRRETWAYMNFKFMTDAVWQWYLAMLPLFLSERFGLHLENFAAPLIAVYSLGYLGSAGGGWLSSQLIRRGWTLNGARKAAMLTCCLGTLPVLLVASSQSLWFCVVLIGIAHGGHQGLTSNLFAVVSDQFPRSSVGTVVGLGGIAAQIGAASMALATGWVLRMHYPLAILFTVAGSAYVVAFLVFHLLVPQLQPLRIAPGRA